LDYSQIELRVAAMMSGDKLMKQIFVNKEDYHLRTAQLVSEIVWGVASDKVTPGMRKAAKITNFRTLFGGGDRSNAKAIKCSIADAEKLREAIFGKFRRLAAWIKECLAESRRTGTTSTWWNGRAAHVRPLWRIADHDDKARSKAEHGAWNTRIQGTAAHFCLASLVECVRWILDDLPPARLALTVHDSLLFEVREDAVPEVAWQAKRIMESWPSDGMPIVADVKIGTRWGSMEKYEVH
jgi:DNA polymerase-1